jgi:hypothetical protein
MSPRLNDRSTTAIAPSGLFEFTNPLTPTGGMLVNCNNPFLSAQQQSAIGCTAADIAAGNNADLSIGRRNVEGGPRVATYDHVNYRLVLGNKGSIGSAWTYDVYGSYYYTTLHQSNDGYVSWSAASRALQVVDVNGTPTCKSVIDQTDRNCVPWNLFSQGGVTQAALNYLTSFGAEYGTVEEKIIAANISGNLGEYGIKSPWASEGMGVSWASSTAAIRKTSSRTRRCSRVTCQEPAARWCPSVPVTMCRTPMEKSGYRSHRICPESVRGCSRRVSGIQTIAFRVAGRA